MMNRSSTLLKLVTLTSSVMLASGFIAYRVGVFDGLMESEERGVKGDEMTATATAVAAPDSGWLRARDGRRSDSATRNRAGDTARRSRAFFGGSKSMPNMIELDDAAIDSFDARPMREPAVEERASPPFMGGSKSAVPFIPAPAPDSDHDPSTDSLRRRREIEIMGSSKSAPVRFERWESTDTRRRDTSRGASQSKGPRR